MQQKKQRRCRALSRSTESARWKIHSIQVDLEGLCGANPVPLNQGVLLALFLACDIADEISLKLQWIQSLNHLAFGTPRIPIGRTTSSID
uniref:Uncharacterized protein n=1 Tax=Aegilops tauschii subsp. strangulata TaxID=200361 RepID=A0A453FN70_AEGTS